LLGVPPLLLTRSAGHGCEWALPLALPAGDALRWSWMRAGSAPRAPRWVGEPPPRPPAS